MQRLIESHFRKQAASSKWLRVAIKRLSAATFRTELAAYSKANPGIIETQQRLRRVAQLSGQLIETLMAGTSKKDSSSFLDKLLDKSELPVFVDVALSTDEETYSRDISAALEEALKGVKLIRERANAAIRPSAAPRVPRKREEDYYLGPLISELCSFWKWATGSAPRFSTPHQKSRRYLGSIMKRPKHITTEKSGPFIDFTQDFLSLAGMRPLPTGQAIAARAAKSNRK